jgi:hypothetical protein
VNNGHIKNSTRCHAGDAFSEFNFIYRSDTQDRSGESMLNFKTDVTSESPAKQATLSAKFNGGESTKNLVTPCCELHISWSPNHGDVY